MKSSAFLQRFRKMDLVSEAFPALEGQRERGVQQKALSWMGTGSLLPAQAEMSLLKVTES